jgi:hypothetical protein
MENGGAETGAWGVKGVECRGCTTQYPVNNGVLTMLPPGDYSRYDYWDKMYEGFGGIETICSARFSRKEDFVINYYAIAYLARKLKWHVSDSVELGSGWGTNSLAFRLYGMTEEAWLVDISTHVLDGAVKVFNNFGFMPFALRADIHCLPFKDRALDISFSGGLYEHFIGKEQESLIAENCRISNKVICQVPEDNIFYWIYRGMITIIHRRWPFGFEKPLKKKDVIGLYEKNGFVFMAKERHNIVTSFITQIGDKWKVASHFTIRPAIFNVFAIDILCAFSNEKVLKKP